jgi:hypothetical protein
MLVTGQNSINPSRSTQDQPLSDGTFVLLPKTQLRALVWFVPLHPLDASDGHIARAAGHLFLVYADDSPQRLRSLWAQVPHDSCIEDGEKPERRG